MALQEVREATQAYVDALRRLDHDGAASAWADDALLMPYGAPDLVGGPATHAMMSADYPELRFVELDIRSTEVEISGDLAFEVTHYDERIGMPNGEDLNLSGRVLFV